MHLEATSKWLEISITGMGKSPRRDYRMRKKFRAKS